MNSDTIEIKFTDGRISRIRIANGWLAAAAEPSAELSGRFPPDSPLPRKCLLVCDQHTEVYAARLGRRLIASGCEIQQTRLPAGETTKSAEWLNRLWDLLAEHGFDRTGGVIAVGGGVIGDLAGFAAATFMRGISWFVVPTTLVAQVDSAIGGKVGINLDSGKNLAGVFWQPAEVWVDPQLLGTLPEREYLSGLAEVVKYGVIADAALFELLESKTAAIRTRDPEVLRTVIWRCCQIKAEVVGGDERETSGLRAKLNYGHTFGHAIEKVAGYGEFLHGEAVAIGMVWAAQTAQRLGLVPAAFVSRQTHLLREFGLPTTWPAAPSGLILEAMKLDKKRHGGLPRLILPRQIGLVESLNWPGDNLVLSAIEAPP
ncbi:MAG: 3-dehydroquinate synthase [Blastopirellula sp.]|jgi:3-dehydroquinate synthase|nr:3-dehydroquinate synthase [Blastopirellula sp.]